MEVIDLNVNMTLHATLKLIDQYGRRENTRNGPVLALPEPLLVTTIRPLQRVLINPLRNANPYFHFMEGLWMLNGSRDVKWISQFNSNMAMYSDDGNILWGAYGFRWRYQFTLDQIYEVLKQLERDPSTRRCVIAMWDPRADANYESRDIPCNTHLYVDVRDGRLNMTVCNRSNDIIWGMFGSNVVHFSMLQEYMANKLGRYVGELRQFSNNAHVYLDIGQGRSMLEGLPIGAKDPYHMYGWETFPMGARDQQWDEDLLAFMGGNFDNITTPFFTKVAIPMYQSWMERKSGGIGIEDAMRIADPAWAEACVLWIRSKT